MARLRNVRRDDLDDREQAAYDRLLQGMNSRPGNRSTEIGGIYGLLLNRPELAARIGAVGDHILNEGGIDLLIKEITCLAVARELNCQCEWTIHEPAARRSGVGEHVIQGVKHRDLVALLPSERLFVDYAWEVLRNDVSDVTWENVVRQMGESGAVNLTVLISFTALICYCMDAFRIDLPAGATPLLPIP
jgi:4-carboxymuconolactone decarboxylase